MNANGYRIHLSLVALLMAMVLVAGGVVMPSLAATNDDPGGATPVELEVDYPIANDATFDAAIEPIPWCFYPSNDYAPTVWYRFTPAQNMNVVPSAYRLEEWGRRSFPIAVYAGMPDSSSPSIFCTYGSNDVLSLLAGTTYYFQVGVERSYHYPYPSPDPLPEPPPAYFNLRPGLQLTMTVDDPSGFDNITGDALISGTVTCSKPAQVETRQIFVRQTLGRKTVIQGSYWSGSWFECRPGSPISWSVRVRPDSATFGGGWAQVSAEMFGYAQPDGEGAGAAISGNIRLRNATER